MSENRYAAPAAACAAAVLGRLGQSRRGLTLAELAREVEHTKSLIYRTLNELERAEFVSRDDHTRYRLGLRAFEVGVAYMTSNPLDSTLRQVLQELAQASREATNLGVLRGDQVLYLMKFDGGSSYVTISRVGGRAPASCVANGKALLAALPVEKVRETLSEPLPTMTPKSHRSLSALEDDLARIRNRGYARDVSEAVSGRAGLAVTVPYPHDPSGRAAISLSLDAVDVDGPEGRRQLDLLRQAGERIRREVDAHQALFG